MILSKPIFDFLSFYFQNLYVNPIKTKAISCCIIASAGNLASQYIGGNKVLNHQSLLAYAAFGLLFGGTIPHFFYGLLEKVISEEASFSVAKKLIVERVVYSPLYIAFTLYTMSRLEGKTHDEALKNLKGLYWTVLMSSWKYLTVLHMINMTLVPPMLRVLILNLTGFFWTIYLSTKRREMQAKSVKKD